MRKGVKSYWPANTRIILIHSIFCVLTLEIFASFDFQFVTSLLTRTAYHRPVHVKQVLDSMVSPLVHRHFVPYGCQKSLLSTNFVAYTSKTLWKPATVELFSSGHLRKIGRWPLKICFSGITWNAILFNYKHGCTLRPLFHTVKTTYQRFPYSLLRAYYIHEKSPWFYNVIRGGRNWMWLNASTFQTLFPPLLLKLISKVDN